MIRLFFIILILCGCVTLSAQNNFYEPSKLQKIEIFFSSNLWDTQLDTAKAGADNFIEASSVRINGETFARVGVKYKGNSSYNATYQKNPMHIELNTYQSQDYHGVQDIKLSNGYADPSLLREALSYKILRNYMDAPLSNLAQVYINGEYYGVFTSSESIGKDFLSSHLYSENGVFVKCNPELTPSPNVKSNLKYLGADTLAYADYYELKSAGGWKAIRDLCDSLGNSPNSLERVLDLDRFLWMLAFNSLFVNLDSYSGAFAQNYYLYKNHQGKFVPIVWDLNMNFGGFPFAGASNTSLGNLSITGLQNLPINLHATDAYWPVIKAVYANPTWKKIYLAHLRTMHAEMVTTNAYLNYYTTLKAVADTAVQSDLKKFYSTASFQNALSNNSSVGSYSVPGIQTFMTGRSAYLQSQSEFTVASPSIVSTTNSALAFKSALTFSSTLSGATTASLCYRFHSADLFTTVVLYDDGLHQDGAANDQVFSTTVVLMGNHIQYYIKAENANAISFSPARAEHEFHELNLHPKAQKSQVVINEFLAGNKSDVKNEFHANEDWIELYNQTGTPLSIDHLFLSDNVKQRCLYRFPAGTVINGDDLLIVWADEFQNGEQLHSGFKLSENGETVLLSDGLTKFDQIDYSQQEVDVSWARCPDGNGSFKSTVPSYRLFNCLTAITEHSRTEKKLVLFPNPAHESITLYSSELLGKIRVFNLSSQVMYEEELLSTSHHLELTNWPVGLYILQCQEQSIKFSITR